MPVSFAKGVGERLVSHPVVSCRRGVHHVNRARRDFRYSLGERSTWIFGNWGSLIQIQPLHVKVEGYRGTDPPRNLDFRERWKIGGFLVRL
jgi:hypothetical protein